MRPLSCKREENPANNIFRAQNTSQLSAFTEVLTGNSFKTCIPGNSKPSGFVLGAFKLRDRAGRKVQIPGGNCPQHLCPCQVVLLGWGRDCPKAQFSSVILPSVVSIVTHLKLYNQLGQRMVCATSTFTCLHLIGVDFKKEISFLCTHAAS